MKRDARKTGAMVMTDGGELEVYRQIDRRLVVHTHSLRQVRAEEGGEVSKVEAGREVALEVHSRYL